ncbi:hypothetical protein ACFQZC_36095 [Streptacidiphilus monticola]
MTPPDTGYPATDPEDLLAGVGRSWLWPLGWGCSPSWQASSC